MLPVMIGILEMRYHRTWRYLQL